MRNLKSVLAVILAVCLMMCLAVPAFAAETTAPADATEGTTEPAAVETPDAEEAHDHEDEVVLDSDDIVIEEEPESGFTKVLRVVLLVLEVISSVALIVVVLMQTGKESGLSGALSGNSDTYMSKSGKGSLDKTLASATKWIALAWILITLALALI